MKPKHDRKRDDNICRLNAMDVLFYGTGILRGKDRVYTFINDVTFS